jgi:hypothetical protein
MPVTLPPSDHGINPDVQTQSGFLHFLCSACGKFSVRLLNLPFEPLLYKYFLLPRVDSNPLCAIADMHQSFVIDRIADRA